MIKRLCALALVLAGGWGGNAMAVGEADALGDADLARLAELTVDTLPLAQVVEMVMAREPAWPFQDRPSGVDARQLACVRGRMGRQYQHGAMLERVRVHAQRDPEGMRRGLRFLEGGGGRLFRKVMAGGFGEASGGQPIDLQAIEASATPEQQQATIALLEGDLYQPLRTLFGLPARTGGGHEAGVSAGIEMVRVLLAPVLVAALDACAVPHSVFEDGAPAAAQP